MTYVFDIDGTICTISDGEYNNAKPLQSRIDVVNQLYEEGHTIHFQTARGMGRTDNSPIYAERLFKKLTEKQLADWGVKYHKLFMGKPAGDIYIDDKGEKDENFFNTRD
jgi:hypothetical protein